MKIMHHRLTLSLNVFFLLRMNASFMEFMKSNKSARHGMTIFSGLLSYVRKFKIILMLNYLFGMNFTQIKAALFTCVRVWQINAKVEDNVFEFLLG